MVERIDAAIVGGGPAGALVARGLAQRGWRVILLERGCRNRDKTCGHCLAARAFPFLRKAGLMARTQAISSGQTRSLCVREADGSRTIAALGGDNDEGGLIVPRDRFDQLLRDAAAEAGAGVWHEAVGRVTDIGDGRIGLRVQRRMQSMNLECRLIVGADGVGSTFARATGLVDAHSSGRKFGFAFDLPAPNSQETPLNHSEAVDMFLAPGGYLGMVRRRDGSMHCGALVAAKGGHARKPSAFIAEVAALHPEARLAVIHLPADLSRDQVTHRFVASGPMPWRPRGVSTRSVALVGDAAGYVEPFTGEGMTWAMHSAALLIQAIDEVGGAWNPAAADMYARMWQSRIQHRQRACQCLARVLERPAVTRWMLRAGRTLPMITRRIVREVVQA